MKVKVRVAVAIDHEGNWNACGWDGADDKIAMGNAVDLVQGGERRYWLEAELDAPEPNNAETVTPEVRGA